MNLVKLILSALFIVGVTLTLALWAGTSKDTRTYAQLHPDMAQSPLVPQYKPWEIAQANECEEWAHQLNAAYKHCHMKQVFTCASISDIQERYLMTRYLSQQILANSYAADGNTISCQNFKRALNNGVK